MGVLLNRPQRCESTVLVLPPRAPTPYFRTHIGLDCRLGIRGALGGGRSQNYALHGDRGIGSPGGAFSSWTPLNLDVCVRRSRHRPLAPKGVGAMRMSSCLHRGVVSHHATDIDFSIITNSFPVSKPNRKSCINPAHTRPGL